MNTPSAQEIVADPDWFLHAINLDTGHFSFVKTRRSALSAASFLDARFDVRHLPTASLGLPELLGYSDSISTTAPRFVFHTAFCCSTLLARCLDLEQCNVSLKEPEVLMTLANYQRRGHRSLAKRADAQAIYRLVTRLLFRPFGENESLVVKPTNTVNNIILPLMSTHPGSRALLLHSDLKSFLISLLKKDEQGRSFARQLFNIFLMDSPEAQQLQHAQLMRMTDLQIAAIVWHLQLEHYFDALEQFGPEQIRSLHCDRLLGQSEDTLARVVSHFGQPALEQNFARMLLNAPLGKNAKTPEQSFSAADRKNEHSQTAQVFKESLDVIIPWAQQLGFKYPYSETIANPL